VIRYASGTLLIGTGHRSTKGWADAVALEMARSQRRETSPVADLIEFWQGYGNLPAVKAALDTDGGVALLRADTWLTSGNLLHAIAAATHQVRTEGTPTSRQRRRPVFRAAAPHRSFSMTNLSLNYANSLGPRSP
jgi:hypothetical protein